jgi:hypothetical protein
MRTRITAALVLCCAAAVFAPGPAFGQTSPAPTPTATPTPTPTPTPVSLPSRSTLLDQMQQAVAARNSYHLVETNKVTVPGTLTLSLRLVANVSTTPRRAHEVIIENGKETINGRTKKLHVKLTAIVSGKHLAIRQGKKAWQCQSLQSVSQATSGFLGSIKYKNAVNLGPTTLNGITVWHVHADVTADLGSFHISVGNQKLLMPTDFYIAQADNTLVREKGTLDTTESGVKVHVVTTVSIPQYGVTVKAKLPAACTK